MKYILRAILPKGMVLKVFLLIFFLVVLLSVFTAYSAGNTVTNAYLHESRSPIDPDDLLPQECRDAGITDVDALIVVQPGVTAEGTDAPELFLGTDGVDVILGRGGADCIVAGAGNERFWFLFWWFPTLWGGAGYDVIIGGPGTDLCSGEVLVQCE